MPGSSDSVSPIRKMPGIEEPDDVAREGLVDLLPVLAHEQRRVREPDAACPVRTCDVIAPRTKRPEQMRRKATRSRWSGSMFAWILKTKPEKRCFTGIDRDRRSTLARRRAGRQLEEALEERQHAEVRERAAEEHRRLVAARATRSRSSSAPAPSSSASASVTSLREGPHRLHAGPDRRPPRDRLLVDPLRAVLAAREEERAARRAGRRRRGTRCPRRAASSSGTRRCRAPPRSRAMRSSGSRPWRSILLTKVKIGIWRRRQTSNSLRVCASTPLRGVDQHHGASAAMSVR